jgi:hypothetical protein
LASGESNTFPSSELRASGGQIYAQIFENRHSNFPRQLLWDVSVKFEPVRYGGEDFTASLACGFIPWNFRDWRALAGASFEKQDQKRGAWAGTFYTGDHNPAHAVRLRLETRKGERFHVTIEMRVDLPEYDHFDQKHEARVAASLEIPFVGLYVVPENLFPKPTTLTDVQNVAAEFVDLGLYQPIEPGLTTPISSVRVLNSEPTSRNYRVTRNRRKRPSRRAW